ncbi:hypothetical protein RFI_29376, partial [Reticulomyxa filosa]
NNSNNNNSNNNNSNNSPINKSGEGVKTEHSSLQKKQTESVKDQLGYKDNDWTGLILNNDKLLPLLKQAKQQFHATMHKCMGYPLSLAHICAVLLYLCGPLHAQVSKDHVQLKSRKWVWLDTCLTSAIFILRQHERVEEMTEHDFLYCHFSVPQKIDLNANTGIIQGKLTTYVQTFFDFESSRTCMLRSRDISSSLSSDITCTLKFHPSMRQANSIPSCNISWLLPFASTRKYVSTVLFAKSSSFADVVDAANAKTFAQQRPWNAHLESEDDSSQVIVLTWSPVDGFLNQTLFFRGLLGDNHDSNLLFAICRILGFNSQQLVAIMLAFAEWKANEKNLRAYQVIASQFTQRRCCIYPINLFCFFLEDYTRSRETTIEKARVGTER